MCPCILCFPEDGPEEGKCNTHCRNEHVGCPLIETEMAQKNATNKDGNFKIVQQPADLTGLTNLYTQKSIEFIQNSIDSNNPFFLYMAYHQTHTPQFSGNKMRIIR